MVDETLDILTYARSGPGTSYDDIGFRWQSANPVNGQVPLRTVGSEVSNEKRHPIELEHIDRLRKDVRALSFGLEISGGRVAYELFGTKMRLRWTREDGRDVDRWSSLADPPKFLLDHAEERDALEANSRRLCLDGPNIRWISFSALLQQGRLLRMQDWQDKLENQIDPRCYYLFLSHRWLTPEQPDPEGRQAALIGWLLVAHLLEAVWVAAGRGLRVPRKLNSFGGYLGVHGSDLAESILVNMLRELPDAEFESLRAEAEHLDQSAKPIRGELGLDDPGLHKLRLRLQSTPAMLNLLGRFRLWYDYSCMPQKPRTSEEEQEFQELLGQLAVIQALSRTVVLLDEVADYFGRAWCTFESGVAYERLPDTLDVWQGANVSATEFSRREEAFRKVLLDRAHLVWRGILDTEVFGVQSADKCMTRLELATTEPEDRMRVYELLRGLGAPPSVHFDDGELLTGVFPLPIMGEEAVIVAESGRPLRGDIPVTSSLDTNDAGKLVAIGSAGVEPFEEVGSVAGRPSAHIAVLGRCEGEAILFAHWVRKNLPHIGNALGVSVNSISWLASDIAPVGHFACGYLDVRPVSADVWITAGIHAALVASYAAVLLKETTAAAGLEYVELELGGTADNVRRYAANQGRAAPTPLRRLNLSNEAITTYAGGLFRQRLMPTFGARP